eukprot:399292_1
MWILLPMCHDQASDSFVCERYSNAWSIKYMMKHAYHNIIQGVVVSESIIVDCLWALCYLSQHDDTIVACLCENGAINICMKLLYQEIGKYEIVHNTQSCKDGMLKRCPMGCGGGG